MRHHGHEIASTVEAIFEFGQIGVVPVRGVAEVEAGIAGAACYIEELLLEDSMPEAQTPPPKGDRKPDASREKAGNVEWSFSPSNPPNLHAKPLIKSRIDREGLRKELERVGIKPE